MIYFKIKPKIAFPFLGLFLIAIEADAQLLKKLGKSAERAAERAVERRVEKETTEKTEAVMDSILEPGKKEKKTEKNPENSGSQPETAQEGEEVSANGKSSEAKDSPKSLSVYSKYDFVAGDKVLFFDDFAADFIGDFPSKWDTNGSGELVAIGEEGDKWFELKPKSDYYPNIAEMPEDFTIEFDFTTLGLTRSTSSAAKLGLNLRDNNSFDWYNTDKNGVRLTIPLCLYAAADISVWNSIAGETTINNNVETDIRKLIVETPHISIAVNGTRLRLWVNETKYLDLPKLVPNDILNYVRFELDGLKDGSERLFIKNVKIAAGGLDLRKKLIAEGKVSTNGILFDSGSAVIQPQSMGIILQISQVLKQETGMGLKIVGHTDADGSEEANVQLSKKRADAIKNALTAVYGIASDRLTTEGKGESEPVGDNATPDGKALNRRVEFIKQ